ncbi:TIGR03960 family B12-binding radical SAM protein [Pseudonocardia nantongensis]|uniref:TIGR03960 family B12-binding radical SAM protein n=1 Tax=Pseudonocardia nantongensis TaxID=1181885 RepID=UPI003979998D
MAPTSVFPALEPILPRVSKPVQYVGGEGNSQVKPWDSAAVRWALLYPDAYEVGLPNQGVQILYEVLNERPDALAERCYAVWPDLEQLMRENAVPAFTVDAHHAIGDFDLLGVSFSTELGYTNLLTTLDLAGTPLHARDRDATHPVVVAGGHAAFNPEPVADFVDVAALGDGEEVVGDITDVVRVWKDEGRPGGRHELLVRLSGTPGCYVPALYDVGYADDGGIAAVTPVGERVPETVQKRTTTELDDWPYPKQPLVPLAETVHERASVEIFRGCTRGCRFCQAGMITRPVRERSLQGVGEMVDASVRASGFDEVGLLSLSSADHSEIAEITKGLADRYEGTNTSLSLPSTRVDAFNIDLANEISRNGRRSGLTFAPEGGSERIRRVINKMVSEDDLIRTCSEAFAQGWRQVKLYFMCGLPTETDEDVLEIAGMAYRVIQAGRKASGRNDVRCTISIGGFVPKPHTPFQWASQCHPETVDARLRKLREAVNADRKIGRNIGMRYHDGEPSLIEGLLARGDRRVGAVIERVWREGGRFDGWSEHFSYDRWVDAAARELEPMGVSLEWFTTRERGQDEILPWDHLDSGLEKDWLWEDWQEALEGREQDDCRWTPCFDCGVCPSTGTDIEVGPSGTTLLPLTVVNPTASGTPVDDGGSAAPGPGSRQGSGG